MKGNIRGYERIIKYEEVDRLLLDEFAWYPGDIAATHNHRSKDGTPPHG